jgi:hypothetical protein
VKASDAETTAERGEEEAEEVEVEADETNVLRRNGEAEAAMGSALRGRKPPPIATAEIIPEWRERDAIGEARASTISVQSECGLASHSRDSTPLSYPLLDEIFGPCRPPYLAADVLLGPSVSPLVKSGLFVYSSYFLQLFR